MTNSRRSPGLRALIAVTVVLSAYVLWLVSDFWIRYFAVASVVSLLTYGLLLGAGYVFVTRVVWRALPARTRERNLEHRRRLGIATLVCVAFFLGLGALMNKAWLPHRFHPLSLIADVGLLIFTVYLGWSLTRPSRRRMLMLFPGGGVFVAFLAIVVVLSSAVTGSNEATALDKLQSLPYLTWVPTDGVEERSGVVHHDPEMAFGGLNLYTPRNLPTIYIMDMKGHVLHQWTHRFEQDDTYGHMMLCDNGDLLAMVKDEKLVRFDWDGNIKWATSIRAHHDLDVDDAGNIYTLGRKDEIIRPMGIPIPILNDYVVVLSPDGEVIREISLYKVLREAIPQSSYRRIMQWLMVPTNLKAALSYKADTGRIVKDGTPSDVMHSNTLSVIDRDIDDVFRKGRLLFCCRMLDIIGVIDPATEALVWSWGPGVIEGPHHPTLLDNGNILLYDNGVYRKYTRVIEITPRTGEIVWEYVGEPRRSFFSYWRGASQRLPNGNTLITNSDYGYAFEVTREGDVVWEYLNPEKRGDKRSAIYRMVRLVDPEAHERLRDLQ